MTVQKAVIVGVREVDIKSQGTLPTGSTGPAGAISGGAVTSAITGNNGALGRAVGAVVGNSVGADLDAKAGEEIMMTIEGGRTVVVVQERTYPPLVEGENVLILSGTPSSGGGIFGGRLGGLLGGGTGGGVRVERDDKFVAGGNLIARSR